MRCYFRTLRVDQTRGSRVGRVSVHRVSMEGCLEEVDVKLGMGGVICMRQGRRHVLEESQGDM